PAVAVARSDPQSRRTYGASRKMGLGASAGESVAADLRPDPCVPAAAGPRPPRGRRRIACRDLPLDANVIRVLCQPYQAESLGAQRNEFVARDRQADDAATQADVGANLVRRDPVAVWPEPEGVADVAVFEVRTATVAAGQRRTALVHFHLRELGSLRRASPIITIQPRSSSGCPTVSPSCRGPPTPPPCRPS